jgi:hypothetical protein
MIRRGSIRRRNRDGHERPANDCVVKGPSPVGKPTSCTDADLNGAPKPNLCAAERGIQRVSIGFAQHQHVDIANWPLPGFTAKPSGPRSIDVRIIDTLNDNECLPNHPRNAERLDEHIRQTGKERAGRVGADDTGTADVAACDQAGGLRSFHLPVN